MSELRVRIYPRNEENKDKEMYNVFIVICHFVICCLL